MLPSQQNRKCREFLKGKESEWTAKGNGGDLSGVKQVDSYTFGKTAHALCFYKGEDRPQALFPGRPGRFFTQGSLQAQGPGSPGGALEATEVTLNITPLG